MRTVVLLRTVVALTAEAPTAEVTTTIIRRIRGTSMKKKKIFEIAVKVIVAALTAALTAITTTSCMGHGPIIL